MNCEWSNPFVSSEPDRAEDHPERLEQLRDAIWRAVLWCVAGLRLDQEQEPGGAVGEA